MLDFKTAAIEECCQLCDRPIEEEEVRLRRVEGVLCVLCSECVKDDNHMDVVEANREGDFFGEAKLDKEPMEGKGTEDS